MHIDTKVNIGSRHPLRTASLKRSKKRSLAEALTKVLFPPQQMSKGLTSIMAVILLTITFSIESLGQKPRLMRFDEDYGYLKDSSRTAYHRLKYIPISQNGMQYLSFGGEIRQEVDHSQHEDWGRFDVGEQTFILQRYQLHADLRLGSRFRIFAQMRSALEDGRKNGPRPIDEDRLNLQNFFFDVVPYLDSTSRFTVRIGRQELQYGSGRILDVREGPNLRQYFDGAKVAFFSPSFKIDAFIMTQAQVKKGLLDNTSSRRDDLWGAYATRIIGKRIGLDLYYLGVKRDRPYFDEGSAKEARHTFGARLWRQDKGLLFNFEIGYQTGNFGNGDISAFGASSEIGYRFDRYRTKPTLRLRNDIISGDRRRGDGNLETFNALYPNGGYFGANPQVGPANLLSMHPNFSLSPVERLNIAVETVFAWRQSTQDGIYLPSGVLNLSGEGSNRRYIGTAYITTASWRFSDLLSFAIGLQYFRPGAFIKGVVANEKEGFFAGSQLSFKF